MERKNEVHDVQPFVAMDKLDEELIIAELQGQQVDTLVYQFENQGRVVTGLSKAGVDAVCREMAKQGEVIRELELNVLDNGTEYIAHVKAGRFAIQVTPDGVQRDVLLDTVFGVKRQPKTFENGKLNPFAYEQAVSKAARNAKIRLLREDLKQVVIKAAIEAGKTIDIKPDAEAPQTRQRPQTKQGNGDRKATEAQIKLAKRLASEEEIEEILQNSFGGKSLDELTTREASALIDELKQKQKEDVAPF